MFRVWRIKSHPPNCSRTTPHLKAQLLPTGTTNSRTSPHQDHYQPVKPLIRTNTCAVGNSPGGELSRYAHPACKFGCPHGHNNAEINCSLGEWNNTTFPPKKKKKRKTTHKVMPMDAPFIIEMLSILLPIIQRYLTITAHFLLRWDGENEYQLSEYVCLA